MELSICLNVTVTGEREHGQFNNLPLSNYELRTSVWGKALTRPGGVQGQSMKGVIVMESVKIKCEKGQKGGEIELII